MYLNTFTVHGKIHGNGRLVAAKWSYGMQDSYEQASVKFKEFSRSSKRLSYCFQGLKSNEILIYMLNSTFDMLESITKDISFRKSV